MPRHRNTRPSKQKLNLPGHRPVGARALKSSIDTLRPWLPGSRVLDLYAGSGRFGLAALEEGAARVCFVEKATALTREISKRIPKDHAERAEIIHEDALSFLMAGGTQAGGFDILFIDPPFDLWSESFALELARGVESVAAEGAILLVKYPARMVAFLRFQRLTPWKSVAFGESKLLYFRK